jgi:hypothetical protein
MTSGYPLCVIYRNKDLIFKSQRPSRNRFLFLKSTEHRNFKISCPPYRTSQIIYYYRKRGITQVAESTAFHSNLKLSEPA